MTRNALLKRIESAIDDAISKRLYGTLEIEFRAGEPTFLRSHRQEKLDETENRSHAQTYKG